MSTALYTDRYELTMLQAALRAGTAERRCVFEVFVRRHLADRRYGVVAGTGRLLDALQDFRFDDPTLAALSRDKVVDDDTLRWLSDYRFVGDINGYREGELFFPGSPVLVVHGTFAEAVLLETLTLSVFNHDSAVATAAARMVVAADGRPCIEMGSRRTHEEAAVAAARAAYIAGFDSTSNLAAGARYGVPTAGTSAHAFTLLHDEERQAFAAQLDALGKSTTLLVDTYDVLAGVRAAVELAGPELGAVRIDSGDLAQTAREVRRLLDELGATHTRIVVTSDLDENAITALSHEPVDAFGVGTAVAMGGGTPTAGFIYKLVARARTPDGPLEPIAKASIGKVGTGGVKSAARRRDAHGTAVAEVVYVDRPGAARDDERVLTVPLVQHGEVVETPALDDLRSHHRQAMAELPADALRPSSGPPALRTIYEEASA
ncbi:MAG: nicotinate phosphoribosyltransferase [Frankiales bacterium]|nr:nicotinate phosphoribosyltransferase [Frankiales bacterium]